MYVNLSLSYCFYFRILNNKTILVYKYHLRDMLLLYLDVSDNIILLKSFKINKNKNT